MIEKASAAPVQQARARGLATAALAFVAVATLLACVATAPFLFKGATLESEIATQVRVKTGLVLATGGQARFDLLPNPHVTMKQLHLVDPSGSIVIDAAELDGEVRLLPLIVGRIELTSATLMSPRLAIDLDASGVTSGGTIGRVLRSGEPIEPSETRHLGVVTLVDGTAVLKSKSLKAPLSLEDVDVTLDWPDLDSPATLTGSLVVEKTAADLAAWIAQPSGLMRGDSSPIALSLHAAPLDLSANGDLARTGTSTFRGHLALSVPSLPALLALAGLTPSPLAPFAKIALNSDVVIGVDRARQANVDLPGLHLALDGNDYEGTLAFQSGSKASLSGTLATDQLSLAPFLAREPALTDARRQWTSSSVRIGGGDLVDLDLRVSASQLRATPFTIEDAALSVMTRGERTELALVEGKAYGGDIKGRVSIGVNRGSIDVRGAASLTNADAAALTWDAFGRQLAAGMFSGNANLETSGASAATLMAHLQGWAKGRASDGELSGIDLGRGLRERQSNPTGASPLAIPAGRTPFGSLTFALRLADGVATIEDATMRGPDSMLSVDGDADVGARTLDLHGIVSPPAMAGAGGKDVSLGIGIKGPFDRIVFSQDPARPANASTGKAR